MERIVKYGEIYKLGDHRLMCGDSTMTDEVETLMGGGIQTWSSRILRMRLSATRQV